MRWQHRHHFLIGAVVTCIPLVIGLATGNVLGHLVFGVALRIVVTHHTTFFINSAAHMFGSRPYTDANTARDNWVLAPLTYGEGYHNFHHLWQWDYRNGALWYQWDTTKWLLNVLAWFGLVSGFRRVPAAAIERARLHMEEKRLRERLALATREGQITLVLRNQDDRQVVETAGVNASRLLGERRPPAPAQAAAAAPPAPPRPRSVEIFKKSKRETINF